MVLFGITAILLSTTPLFAERVTLHYGRILSEDMTVVLATLSDVAEAEVPAANESDTTTSGYQFSLKFDQFVRQGRMPAATERLHVPFSASGYATNWEFGAKPTSGRKVMAHLAIGEDGRWELCPLPGGIVILDDFDQPVVERTRTVCRLWKIPDPARQLERIVAGCRGDDIWFQSFCIRALNDLEGGSTGVNLSGVIDEPMAASIIFELMASKAVVDPSPISSVENVFWNRFRGRGWELAPFRYGSLARSADSIIADSREIHHNVFDNILRKLCRYPEHAEENFQRLRKVTEGNVDIYKFGAVLRMSMIYQPHTTDLSMQQLNGEIFQYLQQRMVGDDRNIAKAAAIAMGDIASEYAAVGPVPDRFIKILQGGNEFSIPDDLKGQMSASLRKLRAVMLTPPDTDAAVLAWPWDNLIGERIVVAGRTCFRDGVHGASAEVRKRRLWMDGIEKWPDDVRGNSPIRLTGRLVRVNDHPVFRYEPGKPLSEGLPVPEGFRLKKASERYVLVEPSWTLLAQ